MIGSALARASVVVTVQIVAIFGERELGAAILGPELDRSVRNRNLLSINQHDVAVDDAPLLGRGRRNDIEISAVETRHGAVLPFADQRLLAAFAKIETAALAYPGVAAGKPLVAAVRGLSAGNLPAPVTRPSANIPM